MSQRLEARLRPEDTYCKPVFARTNKVSNLVLRVKRRRRKRTVEEEGEDKAEGEGERCLTTSGGMMLQGDLKPDYEYSAEVVGVVNTSYAFPGAHSQTIPPPHLIACRTTCYTPTSTSPLSASPPPHTHIPPIHVPIPSHPHSQSSIIPRPSTHIPVPRP